MIHLKQYLNRKLPLWFLTKILLFSPLLLLAQDKQQATDVIKDLPSPYNYQQNEQYKGVEKSTFYLPMRDGNELAIDMWLPKGLKPDTKIPAIVHQTRYWRAPQLRFPFNLFSNGLLGREGKMIEKLIKNGYAFINVDARGSGASPGYRPHPWTADEIKDGAEIVDWIISQNWSNGKVGTAGVSYSGTTAEFLLVNKHPSVKAAVLMFSLFDVYDDNAFPGGVHHQYFTYNWGQANHKLDNNQLPTDKFLAKLMVKGVAPVKGARKKLKKAVRSHKDNLNVHDGAKSVTFRDDPPSSGVIETMDVFSPHKYVEEVNASGAAVYCYSGWFDGPYPHAAIKRYMNLNNPNNKLILGPWGHGGKWNISPHAPGEAGFDALNELLKFFDFHLKGIDTGIQEDAPVHYFTMGAEKWQAASDWPPISNPQNFYFSDHNSLVNTNPNIAEAFDSYKTDTTTGTGYYSRWKALLGMLETPTPYDDRAERDQELLCYTSSPLTEDLEVSGHPIVTLHLSSSATDGSFIVYLEDVAPDGKVHYITEGVLRALHRKTCEPSAAPYKDAVPYRTYKQCDAHPLTPGEVAELTFDLLPTSYQFKKGHSVRIAIACADKDHFKNIYEGEEPTIKVYRSKEYPSGIQLPVVGTTQTMNEGIKE